MWRGIRQEIAIWRAGAMPGIVVIALVIMARAIGGLEFLELTALDTFLRWRSPEPVDEEILIVGINERDIASLPSYPVSESPVGRSNYHHRTIQSCGNWDRYSSRQATTTRV